MERGVGILDLSGTLWATQGLASDFIYFFMGTGIVWRGDPNHPIASSCRPCDKNILRHPNNGTNIPPPQLLLQLVETTNDNE